MSSKKRDSQTNLEETTSKKQRGTDSYASVHGESPKVGIHLVQSMLKQPRYTRGVEISDIQQLILQLLGLSISPKWVQTTHTSLLQKVVVILVGGLGREIFSPSKLQAVLHGPLPTFRDAQHVNIQSPYKGHKVIYPISRLLMLGLNTPSLKQELNFIKKKLLNPAPPPSS